MLHLVIWLLASGCVTLCSPIHREYHLISEAKTWAQAQSYCRNSYTDLASVSNRDDMRRLVEIAAASGEGSSKMHVVLEEKSWRSAQGYCRQNYHDLASVSSQTENQALQQMLNESGPSTTTFWIGLFRDQWTWSDQSNSSFRYWESDQPNHDGECVLFDTFYETLWDRACGSSFPFYCYSAVTWRYVVRLELKSDSSLNLGDSATSEAILAQIQKRFEGARVQWRVQPDGTIFKKKE
ncbi:secretory phospholipase A2 receptor-like isoform X2 [Acanthopagrus latus]|uniref:secretory phospholipase A2 receptor-like isoform X2 n=1 Tax=Acanthopagrus latus TaxID=8177 RepID=UPI00187C0633|nr:secretory phospholipase A2 receptor-like isoform X2 [Acanthopagrus latus]